jgi:hypothetical protein
MNLKNNLGMTLLAVLLILEGLVRLFSLTFSGLNVVLGILALVAGALILLGK